MMRVCSDQCIGVLPWGPLARGKLTRDWGTTTARLETDEFGKMLYDPSSDRVIVERVAEVALAWSLSKSFVTALIVDVTKPHHLDDAVAAVDVELAAEEVARLEEPYVPHSAVGFR
jgi:aryl-alcohol dehydrogenase (NADP+)